jgi:hypothetical protein
MTDTVKISHSDEIKELVGALAKAQGVMKPAVFNKMNPHFKSRYADFSSCMDACRAPLSENGLAIIQSCETTDGKLNLITMLAHSSGQWMKSEFPIISNKMDSQGIGSAMTYAKRYSLCGMIGIVADEDGDDDGESAVGRGKKEEKPIENKLPKLLAMFNPEDKDALMQYIDVVINHLKCSELEAINKLVDEPGIIEKFNVWKGKRKKQ